eukprot:6207555-Pleurochrysis_carterae.AAC.2
MQPVQGSEVTMGRCWRDGAIKGNFSVPTRRKSWRPAAPGADEAGAGVRRTGARADDAAGVAATAAGASVDSSLLFPNSSLMSRLRSGISFSGGDVNGAGTALLNALKESIGMRREHSTGLPRNLMLDLGTCDGEIAESTALDGAVPSG